MNPYQLAKRERGVVEWRDGDNPIILDYFKDAGHSWVQDDETAWCAAFVCAMLERSGQQNNPKTLRARDFEDYGRGVSLDEAKPGDLCVFSRGSNPAFGHVAFYEEHDRDVVRVFGANQANSVNSMGYARSRLIAVRRGYWNEKENSVTFWQMLRRLFGG